MCYADILPSCNARMAPHGTLKMLTYSETGLSGKGPTLVGTHGFSGAYLNLFPGHQGRPILLNKGLTWLASAWLELLRHLSEALGAHQQILRYPDPETLG